MTSHRLIMAMVTASLAVAGRAGLAADARDGPPDARWSVAWDGSEQAAEAAHELAAYMAKVLGADVRAAPWGEAAGGAGFLVTEEKYAPDAIRKELEGKRLDAFLIKYPCVVDGRQVCLLVSRDEWGCMFPVCHFLTRHMGVEWVGPEPAGEVVTAQPNWRMPERIDELQDPGYEHRSWASFALDSRRWLANGRRLQFHHGLHHVFDPRRYAEQTDLYPFYEGERHVPDGSIRRERISAWQPCTSNPRAVDIAVQYGLEFLARHPERLSFSLSVNDGGVGYCMCEACRAQDSRDAFSYGNPRLSDRFYRFYNRVAERVLQERPDAYVAVLGYNRVKTPPTEVKIHPRILVFNCVDNTNPQPDMAERQRAWKAAGATPCLYFRLNDAGYLTVRHYPHALADIIRLSHELGGFGLYTETATIWAAGAPKFYVLARVLWDTDADIDELLDRYMRLAFGPAAAPAVREYFDRWEAIWERGDPDLRYNTTRDNTSADQLRDLTRPDLEAMDAALARAQAAPGTSAEKTRLEYVTTYYKWLRPNADQYLLATELSDAAWLSGRSPDAIFREAERGLALTDEFNRLWEGVISPDTTGWLLSVRFSGHADECWRAAVEPVRLGVLAAYEAAVDVAFNWLTEGMLKAQPRAQVAGYWREQMAQHPDLAAWAKTQLYLLERGPGENLLPNGDFERGTGGQAPQIERWKIGGSWQGIPSLLAWEAGRGRNGSAGVGIGHGREGALQSAARTRAGNRYRFGVWYNTSDDATRVWLHGLPAGRLGLHPTSGQWACFSTTFTAPQDHVSIRLEVRSQDEGRRTWFDDAELVTICEN